MATIYLFEAAPRDKNIWAEFHLSSISRLKKIADVVLYGDSIIKNYGEIWRKAFGKMCLNFGFGGDGIENVLYRVEYGVIPSCVRTVIVHVGINTLSSASSKKVANGIHQI